MITSNQKQIPSIPNSYNLRTEWIIQLFLLLTVLNMNLQYLSKNLKNNKNSELCHHYVYTSPIVYHLDTKTCIPYLKFPICTGYGINFCYTVPNYSPNNILYIFLSRQLKLSSNQHSSRWTHIFIIIVKLENFKGI